MSTTLQPFVTPLPVRRLLRASLPCVCHVPAVPFGEVLPIFAVFAAVPDVIVVMVAVIDTVSARHPDAHLGAPANATAGAVRVAASINAGIRRSIASAS